MSIIKKVVVKQQDNPDSQVRWITIGIYINKDGKEYLKLNQLPLGNWDGFAHIFEDNEKDGKDAERKTGKTGRKPAADEAGGADEVPF